MYRPLFTMVAVLGITLGGCAGDVEDSVPPPPAPQEQLNPPVEELSAPLRNREETLMAGIVAHPNPIKAVPPKERVPGPKGPPPEAN